MPGSSDFRICDVFTISGSQIADVYDNNKMKVHFQGMSKTLQFPQTIALQGAPTCSIGISPDGTYNRLNDAGRLILLYQNAIQFASVPFVRVEDNLVMLTSRSPESVEGPGDVPALKNYYHSPIDQKKVAISIATPLAEWTYKLGKIEVVRRVISPLLSGNNQALMPIGVEEYEVRNGGKTEQRVTLVIPRPSLVNLQEKELKPTDQDTVYLCSTAVKGHMHEEFSSGSVRGVVMSSTECSDKMVLAVAEVEGVEIDIQPHFCLNRLKQDLLLNEDGSFFEKKPAIPKQDYGAAISLTVTLEPGAVVKMPIAIVLDFPTQRYIDGKEFERKYVKSFEDADSRAAEMACLAIESYQGWWDRTATIQKKMLDCIQRSPSYKGDKKGALTLLRLMLNELSFPLSNATVWIEDEGGNDVARFLECFDYAYINSSDVDWYSMVLLILFPQVEQELCQSCINSILAEDKSERYYHLHASFVEARQHFENFPEEYTDVRMSQVKDAVKVKGSVAHDLGALPKGHPLRNVSDYAWYNSNYWIDLFPKLATRVLRNVKFTGNVDFLKKNWETLKFGFDHLEELDFDGDGIPEGNPDEVKNTFDNLPLFGIDAYDLTMFMAGCQAMRKMAEIVGDEPAKERYQENLDRASQVLDKMWRDEKVGKGRRLRYYICCYDPETGKKNTDVWANQLDALWALVAMGEEPFVSEERVKNILKTIYDNNQTHMGWAMCRTESGGAVKSEQGQDVYTTSNYVLAQLLDFYGMVKESKEIYKRMDKVVFGHGNSLITPDNLRAELEKEMGESKPGPHYIVAAYPRPGAVLTQLVFQFIRDYSKRARVAEVDSKELHSFVTDLMA